MRRGKTDDGASLLSFAGTGRGTSFSIDQNLVSDLGSEDSLENRENDIEERERICLLQSLLTGTERAALVAFQDGSLAEREDLTDAIDYLRLQQASGAYDEALSELLNLRNGLIQPDSLNQPAKILLLIRIAHAVGKEPHALLDSDLADLDSYDIPGAVEFFEQRFFDVYYSTQ